MDNISRSNQGHMAFKRLHRSPTWSILSKCAWNTYMVNNIWSFSFPLTFDLGWHWRVISSSLGVYWVVYYRSCRSCQSERLLVLHWLLDDLAIFVLLYGVQQLFDWLLDNHVYSQHFVASLPNRHGGSLFCDILSIISMHILVVHLMLCFTLTSWRPHIEEQNNLVDS